MRGLSLVFSRWHCGTSFWPLSPWIPLYLSQALPTPLPLPELSPDPCCCCVSRVAGFMLLPALLLSLASQLGTLISQQLDPASTAFGLPGPQALQQWGGDRELGLGGVSLCVPLPRKLWIGRCACRQGLDSQMLGRVAVAGCWGGMGPRPLLPLLPGYLQLRATLHPESGFECTDIPAATGSLRVRLTCHGQRVRIAGSASAVFQFTYL